MKTLLFGGKSSLGKLFFLIGILVAAPVLVLPFYPEESGDAWAFLVPSLFSFFLGTAAGILEKKKRERDDFRAHLYASSLTVLAAWGYGILAGAAPFLLTGRLGFVQALFEAVSGWTTTGLSVIDVSAENHIFLFHRSFMQFCGGLGFVMMMIVFVQEKESIHLYQAEGHSDRLMPSLGKTARLILKMYCAFLLIGTCLYVLYGMPFFESINHAMCALSTGGFSTRLESLGAYKSLTLELITSLLMLIGTTNFAILLLLVKGKFRLSLQMSELRFLFWTLLAATPIAAWSLSANLFEGDFLRGLREASFNLIAAVSTTGFSTMSYQDWPELCIGLLIVLMLIGGGIGSTAGGMKLIRVYILTRMTVQDIKKKVHSKRRVSAPYFMNAQGRQPLDGEAYHQAAGYVVLYGFIFVVGSMLLTETAGCTLTEAMFEFASSLGTVGLSIGITGPTTNDATLLVEMAGMMLGRLEIYIVFIGIYSAFDRLTGRGRNARRKNRELN